MPRYSPSARRALTDERRRQILKSAAEVFAAKGFDRATIADIARHASVAEGSIYNYFKNKSDLLVSIPRQIVQAPIENLHAAIQQDLSPRGASPEMTLTTMATNMVATLRQNAPIFRILISSLPSMKPAMREKYYVEVVLYGTGMLEAYFKEQIKQGAFRRDLDAQIASRAFIGMFFPYILLHDVIQLESDASWDYDRLIATAVPLFLRGALVERNTRTTP